MAKFFTADTHFFHDGIRHKCDRPFDSVDAMNEALIERWNETVGKRDDVWLIGDFAMENSKGRLLDVFERLHGFKRLVPGNHDHKRVRALPWHEILANNVEVKDGEETNYITATLGVYISLYNVFTSLLSILGLAGSRE